MYSKQKLKLPNGTLSHFTGLGGSISTCKSVFALTSLIIFAVICVICERESHLMHFCCHDRIRWPSLCAPHQTLSSLSIRLITH